MHSKLIVGVAVLVGWTLLAGPPAQAAIVRLSNGDQLTGRIVAEQPNQVQLEHEVLGLLSIKKAQVAELVRDKPAAASPYATVPPAPPARQPRRVRPARKYSSRFWEAWRRYESPTETE